MRCLLFVVVVCAFFVCFSSSTFFFFGIAYGKKNLVKKVEGGSESVRICKLLVAETVSENWCFCWRSERERERERRTCG